MSVRSVSQCSWTRVCAAAEGTDGVTAPDAFPLRFVTPDPEGARVWDVSVVIRPGEIVTIEPGVGVPLLQDVEARLQWDDAANRGAAGAGAAIVRAGFRANAESLGLIEADLRFVRGSVAGLAAELGPARGIGLSDLPHMSEILTDVDAMLSHVSYSVGRLTQLARLMRREAAETGTVPREELDALIQQGDALSNRVEFCIDRHRFHARDTAQQIATSDLNIVKIFTVLWAILIPGTTLINWYGQNFEFMPELSWEYSAWVQIIGVFCLAVIPIYTVKRAGQLR